MPKAIRKAKPKAKPKPKRPAASAKKRTAPARKPKAAVKKRGAKGQPIQPPYEEIKKLLQKGRTRGFVTEDEVLGIGGENLTGFYSAMKYFQSLDNENNKKFVAAFKAKYGAKSVIGDVTQAAYLGPWLWKMAVEKANSFDIDKVAAASPDIEFKEAPEGYVKLHKNHHLWSKLRIGQWATDGQAKVLYESGLIEPDPFPKGYQ